MPEKTIMKLNEREIGWEERHVPASVDRADDSAFIGEFISHPVCCARPNGARQTFTVHVSSPGDSKFLPLRHLPPPPPSHLPFIAHPASAGSDDDDINLTEENVPSEPLNEISPKSSSEIEETENKQAATKATESLFTADFVNTLKITGIISAKARGKELVVAICNKSTGKNFAFRVNFALEAHCFWIPTPMYRHIVSQEPVRRGEKSYAYPIPDEYVDGPATGCKITIQAAFIRPNYTLLFVDHNSMIQLHVMQMPERFTPDALQPGSEFWHVLWSRSHGPVYSQEPEATMEALNDWRVRMSRDFDKIPISACMKADQTVFNGSGAQETSDQLFLALIHPQMPAYYVCTHDELWNRFLRTIIDYDTDRMELAAAHARLPAVSGDRPFYMNTDGHTKYLHHIPTYRRAIVGIYEDRLRAAHDLGLFLPNAIIQPDGHAELPPGAPAKPSVATSLRTDRGQKFIKAPNFLITVPNVKCYTPFTARPAPAWEKGRCEPVLVDVKDEVNVTTLGLYSFRIFVDCVWSVQRIGEKPLPLGRRKVVGANQSVRKRPLAEKIAQTSAPKKRVRLWLKILRI
ncbi:hypothetical protein C8R43DRAFT_1140555 [Mycena crocata]|nr:hypothetical protein C8R43DRAFT_1140555 [Mycena crocata]